MSQLSDDLRRKAARIVTQRLESLQQAGVLQLPKAGKISAEAEFSSRALQHPHAGPLAKGEGERMPAAPATTTSTTTKNVVPMTERSLFDSAPAERKIMPLEQRAAALEVIQSEVAACTRCSALVANRTQTVFGVGNIAPRICFFGEAPGADEDRLGEPFVGRGGQLLNKMIAACGLKREEVYIFNVLKCRPPDNRNPLPDEVANCRGYFERQFEILRPEIICCLGAVASQALLSTDRGIGKLRGRFHDYQGIPVVCTYHPAYLLRNPAAKADAWEDLKLMMRRLGVEL